MQAVRFVAKDHMEMVQSWCKARGVQQFQAGWLPTVGFIVPGVCCAWLYVTDSDLHIMENIISNPESDPLDRGEAIDEITKRIAETSKEMGGKWLIGASNIESVIDRATNVHGFIKGKMPVYQLIKVL